MSQRRYHISKELRERMLADDPKAFDRFLPSVKHLRWITEEVIFGTDTKWGKWFDVVLLWAILLSLLAIMVESTPPYGQRFADILRVVEWIFTGFFTLEYLLRLWISEKPSKYAFSFFGIVDFLAVIPTYLSLFIVGSQYLMVIRALRLLRVFRVLKLARYLSGARILLTSLYASKEKIFVFLSAVLTLVTILGTIMYLIEGGDNGFDSIPRSIYWAIVTLTTVGYGDIAPVTTVGQFLAAFIMILGYAIIAVPTGIVGVEFSKAVKTEEQEVIICDRCGETSHLVGARYCQRCGEKLPE